ncbi:MAG: replication-associated recombination protein A [Polyangiaceae bacterium]|nr:replication-associated recombination protein A [Polyangiaceae bacterium]
MTRKRVPPGQPTLLQALANNGTRSGSGAPLADRMRPSKLAELLGQQDIVGEGKLLRQAIEKDRLLSMILWGPPGSGKTSLATVVARATKSEFVPFSAVLSGLAELRIAIAEAKERRAYQGRPTVLFVDEIHRFNKSQQDAFLPHLEDGTITLIGATTENPSFAVNAALISRCRVFRLEALSETDLMALLRRALTDEVNGLGKLKLGASEEVLLTVARTARGDARRALGILETAAELAQGADSELLLSHLERVNEDATLLYDKAGEEHYNVASALIKSLRGTDPDASLYWLFRMLESGDDPLFLLRRLIIFASEDIGNADPNALTVAVNADAAFRRMGMPEGIYPISHACLYLASAPKSGAVKDAIAKTRAAIAEHGALPVPKKLRNAVTKLMQNEGYGSGYRYAHDYQGGYVPGETYLPEKLVGSRFYEPTERGFEKRIFDKLKALRAAASSKEST